MYVYIVYNKRHDFFEVYRGKPKWVEEYNMWLGKDFMLTLGNRDLKEEHARALRLDGKPRKFFVSINVLFEEKESLCS